LEVFIIPFLAFKRASVSEFDAAAPCSITAVVRSDKLEIHYLQKIKRELDSSLMTEKANQG